MKANFNKQITSFFFINFKNINFFLFQLYNIINNLAAFLLNVFFLYELISRAVIFIYFLKNIFFFLYYNQKKQIFINHTNLLYTNYIIFFKIMIRPYNYSFVYTLFDFSLTNYDYLDVYFFYKAILIERFHFFLYEMVNNEIVNIILGLKKINNIKNIYNQLKINLLGKTSIFLTYNYTIMFNKIAYIFGNNLSNIFYILQNDNYNGFYFAYIKEFPLKDTAEYLLEYIVSKILPFFHSIYIGYYRTFIYSIVCFFNIYVVLQLQFFTKKYNEKRKVKIENLDVYKFEIFSLIYLYVYKIALKIVYTMVDVMNDIKKMVLDLPNNEDFTIFDMFYYFAFVYQSPFYEEYSNFENVLDNFFYIRRKLKILYFKFYFNYVELFSYMFLPYFTFYGISNIVKLFLFSLNTLLLSFFSYTKYYIIFFKELFCALNYFLDLFYFFITSSFYSEHIIVLLLIEFFLEFFGLSINSIEFIISLIFIIVSSIITSQALDFFENYNLEILIETFSFFFFAFSFLYEQQKILISFLNSKIKAYKLLKILNKFGLKFYQINKQNIKIIVLLEKIKKIKIK